MCVGCEVGICQLSQTLVDISTYLAMSTAAILFTLAAVFYVHVLSEDTT